MGYRSDVAIGFLFKDHEQMLGFVTAERLVGDKRVLDALKEYRVIGNLLHTCFENVKWYDSYDDVQSHMGMIARATANGISTAFLRIGEEDEDTEVKITCGENYGDHDQLWELFKVTRTMEHPNDGELLIKEDK